MIRKEPFKTVVIDNLTVPAGQAKKGTDCDREAKKKAADAVAGILGRRPESLHIRRKSVDARRRNSVRFVYSFCADIADPTESECRKLENAGYKFTSGPLFRVEPGHEKPSAPPVIAGF